MPPLWRPSEGPQTPVLVVEGSNDHSLVLSMPPQPPRKRTEERRDDDEHQSGRQHRALLSDNESFDDPPHGVGDVVDVRLATAEHVYERDGMSRGHPLCALGTICRHQNRPEPSLKL